MKKALLVFPRMKLKPFGEQTYLAHLLRAMNEQATDWEFTTYAVGLRGKKEHQERMAIIDESGSAKHVWNPLPLTVFEKLIRAQLPTPDIALFKKSDIVHSFNAQLIPLASKNFVLTIHDLSNLRFLAGNDTEERNNQIRIALKILTDKARAIITISHFSKAEIVELLNIEPSKISVIHNGVDTKHFRPIVEQERIESKKFLARIGVNKPYLLHIGGASPRKNLLRLINTYTLLRSRNAIDYGLIIGGLTKPPPEIAEALNNSPYKNDIHLPGYLPENELLWLLQSAELLVFPSLYEGFGMPPLEAMACGVPVVLAHSTSLPEVGGDAALYCDPLKEESIAESVVAMLSNEIHKQQRIKSGLLMAQKMSWANNARQTLQLYSQITGD